MKLRSYVVMSAGLLVTLALPFAAQAANKLIVKDSTGTTDKLVVTDTGSIGIGVSAPQYPIQVRAGGVAAATTLELRNTGNSTYTKYDAPGVQFIRNNISTENGGLPYLGDRLGSFYFGAFFTGTLRYGAGFAAYSDTSSGTATSFPAYLSFETTTLPNPYPSEKMRITSSGNVGIGTSSPSQKLEVNGGVKFNTSTAKPACDSAIRGTLWFTRGSITSPITADTLQVCVKDGSNNYLWHTLY